MQIKSLEQNKCMIVDLEQGLRTQRSYKLFLSALDSPRTITKYDRDLLKIMQFADYPDYDSIVLDNSEIIQKHLEDYVMEIKTRTNKRSTVKNQLQAIELFLEVNKKTFYRKALHLMYPKETTKTGNEYPYSNEDILKMLEHVKSKRTIALIHFFASTGARPAVIDDPILTFKNIHPMKDGCKAVFLYDESNEEYWAFLTPEASKALEEYVDERIFLGEKITQDSPVFTAREKQQAFNPDSINHLDHVSLSSVMVRTRKESRIENHKTGHRFEKGLFLGFRKRFNTILKIDSEINSNIAEKLMAHKRGLDGVYFKPTREECFSEFTKAIPQLTLNESERLRFEVNNLTENKDDIIKQYEKRISRTENLLKRVLERLEPS